MADLHESLVRAFRKKVMRKGMRESKSPMPTYRPDIFAEKVSEHGSVLEQVAVEAEIPSTLFTEHTSHQLITMHGFIRLQRAKRIRVRGYLLVPRNRKVLTNAKTLLFSLFPEGTPIEVVEAA